LAVGKGAKAVEMLKAGLAIAPDDPALRLNYGIALVNQNSSPPLRPSCARSCKSPMEITSALVIIWV